VSKVCHSQLSSSTFASAAAMPPCAAPVWERVGYSFEMTAVRAPGPASIAARIPAPPAPTMTMSYWWKWTPSTTFVSTWALSEFTGLLDGGAERGEEVGGCAGGARVEREDDEGAEHDQHDRGGEEPALQQL